MQTERITLDRNEARRLYREYKKHVHFSTKEDHAIRRAYQAIAQGKMVIKAMESIVAAGLGADGFPKLAIARADAQRCLLRILTNGSGWMASDELWTRSASKKIEFPALSFPPRMNAVLDRAAMVPIIPVHLRPRRALEQYHILFEAEWRKVVPKDPYLLRRIGDGDMWVVVAHWDLTEVERAALAHRLNLQ
jgi:hypothetical protein